MGAERGSKSERKYHRAAKARIRGDFAPSGDQLEVAKIKAQNRLEGLSRLFIGLLDAWAGQTEQTFIQQDFAKFKNRLLNSQLENHDMGLTFSRLMAAYITATPTDAQQSQHVLDFVERIWLRFGLGLIEGKEREAEIGIFLNACPEKLVDSLSTPTQLPTGQWLPTSLQQVKGRVIDHTTGALK